MKILKLLICNVLVWSAIVLVIAEPVNLDKWVEVFFISKSAAIVLCLIATYLWGKWERDFEEMDI